jgi:hypothetical protein
MGWSVVSYIEIGMKEKRNVKEDHDALCNRFNRDPIIRVYENTV